ncbi:response regulator [Candidatus Poribacteria bacterium]|nr:response regulator [Candidatus Poribacteria bacterium]
MRERILVVDDEPDILDLIELTLRSEEFDVLTARNGIEALEVARTSSPDLVLLDLSMPGMDGFETMEALRADERTSGTPIILLTARVQIADKLRGLSSGADDYITKPFEPDALVSRVLAQLSRSRRVSYSNPLMGAHGEWSNAIEQLARHLEAAAQIQLGLLPREEPRLPGMRVVGMLQSSLDVGGDFYDFIPLDDDKVGVAIADIRGKGIPAALLMVMVRTVLRIVAREEPTPARVIKRINDFLAAETEPDLFATMVYGVIDPRERTFTYANGGHCHPLLVNANRSDAVRLTAGGMLVGVFELAEYVYGTVELDPGDLIVVYTDGLTEAENPSGELFGDGRLGDLTMELARLPADAICDTVRLRLTEFSGTSQRSDDLTVVAIQVTA